ncbi:hypothetical protein HDU85_005000 [Gaertneriomyces sp. JEL0708]|nr:hypothetical protein HDU85_005000 [Gaertneriomyces sp. JEL0708]
MRDLPPEVLLLIFTYADSAAVCACSAACKRWHALIHAADEHIWKPRVLKSSPLGLQPALKAKETWRDVYSLIHIWKRPLKVYKSERLKVPVIDADAPLPGSSTQSKCRLLASYVATREADGARVLLKRACTVDEARVVYVWNRQLWSTRLDQRHLLFLPDRPIDGPAEGPSHRIDPCIRSDIYVVCGDNVTVFRRMSDDKVIATISGVSSEEGITCGAIHAMHTYDDNAMCGTLQLARVPDDEVEESTLDSDEDVVFFARFRMDDSLSSTAMNEHLVAYKIWSRGNQQHVTIHRIEDQSLFANLCVETAETDVVVHLHMTRFHLVVACNSGRTVHVYDLCTMRRLHTISLSDIFREAYGVEWIDVLEEEAALLFGLEDRKILWIDLKDRRTALYHDRTGDDDPRGRSDPGLWVAYQLAQNTGRPKEFVAFRARMPHSSDTCSLA